MHLHRSRRLLCGVFALALAACSGGRSGASTTVPTSGASTVPAAADLPAPLHDLLTTADGWRWFTTGDDLFEVWVCHVPLDSTADIYEGMQLRLPLTADGVTEVLAHQVTPYFDTLSLGQYHPVFRPGGELQMTKDESPEACVDDAIASAGDDAHAVFVVADAEHGATQPGGWGEVGSACDAPPCSVAVTGRAAYIGASDFHPDWGDAKPMDLAEHEVGHTLGWMHSAVEKVGQYLSAIDLMSNSAAPRDVDDTRRDGPDTIGLNRVLAGWLPLDDVWTAPAGDGTVTLTPSMSASGTRLAVVPIDATHFLTIELLTADGFDAHLPHDGIAVHMVTVKDGIVQDARPLVGEAPYADLLQPGGSVDAAGWHIEVDAGSGAGAAATWTVTLTA